MQSDDVIKARRKALRDALTHELGGTRADVKVYAYYDEDESHQIAVATCLHLPSAELATYSSLTLSMWPNLLDGVDVPVELMIVTRGAVDELANVVATAAFNVMKDGWLAAPGVVFPHAIAQYLPEASTPHIMWMEPWVAPDLSTVRGDDWAAHFLQGAPLTDDEWSYLRSEGFYELLARFDEAEVDLNDLDRASALA